MTTERFIQKAREVHGNKYDYSKTEVIGDNKTEVCVICPEHGEFWTTPNNHLRGARCPGCFGTPKLNTQEFIERANRVHHGKYDYSKAVYKGNKSKVEIICPEHGPFWQNASTHMKGSQCPVCSNTQRITQEVFLERAPKIHDNKYDYSKVHFENLDDFVTIICPVHGEYQQKAKVHIRGYGCPMCGGSKRLTTEEFAEKANKVHEGKYDYCKSEYVNTSTKVCIICPEHGEFWQTPSGHMNGQGCPSCNQKHLERDVMLFLRRHKIKYEAQKTFPWLRFVNPLHLDFFLPEYSVVIECQGGQHFKAVEFYGGEEGFKNTVERDTIKKRLCEEHGIQMLYYSDLGIMYPYDVIEDFDTLMYAIEQRGFVEDTHLWKESELPFVFD